MEEVRPRFAGFWIRTVAYLIDSFILFLLSALLVAVGLFGYMAGADIEAFQDFHFAFYSTRWNFLNLIAFAVNMTYFTWFLGWRGQTPGKTICGLKVLRTDGTPVSYGQAAIRTLGYTLNHLTLCLGFLWVAVDRRKQGLHDKIAGTVEIRLGLLETREPAPLPPRDSPPVG